MLLLFVLYSTFVSTISAFPSLSAPLSVFTNASIAIDWKNVDTNTVDSYIGFWQQGHSPLTVPSEPVAVLDTSWTYLYGQDALSIGLMAPYSAGKANPPSSGSVVLKAPSVSGRYIVWLCYNNCASTPCINSTRCPANLEVAVSVAPSTTSSTSPPSSTLSSSYSSFTSTSSSTSKRFFSSSAASASSSRRRLSTSSEIIAGTDDINSVSASSYSLDQGAKFEISWSCFPADVSHAKDQIGLISLLDNPQNTSAIKQFFQPTGKNKGSITAVLSSSLAPGIYVLVYYYGSGSNSDGAFVSSSPLLVNKQGLSVTVSTPTFSNNSVNVGWSSTVSHSPSDCLKVCILGQSECVLSSPELGVAQTGKWLASLPSHNIMYDVRYFAGCSSSSPVAFSKPISAVFDYLTYTSLKLSSLPHSIEGAVDTGAGIMITLGILPSPSSSSSTTPFTRSVMDAIVLRRASDPVPTANPYSSSYSVEAGEMGWVYLDSIDSPTIAFPLSAGPGYYYVYYFSANSSVPIARSALIQATPLSLTCPSKTRKTPNRKDTSGQQTSDIEHMIIVITENHSFDSIFGKYCSSPPSSFFPTCNSGPECCEAAPQTIQRAGGSGTCTPNVLDDAENLGFDRSHSRAAIKQAVNNGSMDSFVNLCSEHGSNFAVANQETMKSYFDFARNFSLIDNYWQSAAGASCQSDVFLARAGFAFYDCFQRPAYPSNLNCYLQGPVRMEPTIAHLLLACGNSVAYYGEGFNQASEGCYPSYWDPTDSPFAYYHRMPPLLDRDLSELFLDIANGNLPAVSYVKALGIHSEHGGLSTFVDSQQIWTDINTAVQRFAQYKDNTVLISVPDEGGGFYDHVGNTKENARWPDGAAGARIFQRNGDSVSYGGRLPFLATGAQVKTNFISHAMTEHTSIIKFQEFNWLGGVTGHLGTRDLDSQICNLQSVFNEKAGTLPIEADSCNSGLVLPPKDFTIM